MDELFEKFKRGEVPNVLELMAAISELSELWPVDVCLDCRSSQSCDSTQQQPETAP
ncbi:unnamed protein product [marine sediment metagenome]|uniref:Uncharacterized protein n=1 Tax=marine sediment metagenome TaxID=412755 RepID=X1EYN4_9ZZZZ